MSKLVYYLREVQTADEKIRDHFMLETKLEIFEGNKKSLEKDRNYWMEEGAHKVRYYELKEHKF